MPTQRTVRLTTTMRRIKRTASMAAAVEMRLRQRNLQPRARRVCGGTPRWRKTSPELSSHFHFLQTFCGARRPSFCIAIHSSPHLAALRLNRFSARSPFKNPTRRLSPLAQARPSSSSSHARDSHTYYMASAAASDYDDRVCKDVPTPPRGPFPRDKLFQAHNGTPHRLSQTYSCLHFLFPLFTGSRRRPLVRAFCFVLYSLTTVVLIQLGFMRQFKQ